MRFIVSALTRNTSTVAAMAPISSRRLRAGTVTSMVPAASACMMAVSWRIGCRMLRALKYSSGTISSRTLP